MASRRWQRALAGLGEGLGNWGTMKLRQSMQDASQDRYDDRQTKNAEAIAKRQESAANRALAQSIDAQVAAGTLEPSQAAAMKESLIGLSEDAESFESIRPSPRRRMESKLGKSIMDADAPEKVPSPEDVFGIAEEQGVESRLPAAWSEGMIPADNDPFQNATPIVRAYGERAQTRRRALESAPTEKVTGKDATGAAFTQMLPRTALLDPFRTSPGAASEGALAGATKVAELAASGDALATQKAKETKAVQAVELSPDATNARVNEARRKRSAELAAELAQTGLTPQQQSAALQLSDDFYTQSKDYLAVAGSFQNIATMAQRINDARRTGGDSPASHIGMVFNFMKMQDPQSTVREGEQAQAANAGGVSDRVRNIYNSLLLGGRLSNEQVKDFSETAKKLYESELRTQQGRVKDFSDRAVQFRVPPSIVVREPDPNIGETDAARRLRERGGR